MSLIGGHLGARASALLDGALTPEETERAWLHVHECQVCRDSIEREAWLKRRLACLSVDPGVAAPDTLKGSLRGGPPPAPGAAVAPAGMVFSFDEHRGRHALALAALGTGVLGTAVMGILAFGAGPADAPTFQRHTPVTAVNTPAVSAVHHARSQR